MNTIVNQTTSILNVLVYEFMYVEVEVRCL